MRSPFFGKTYSIYYEHDVYGYYIDPNWDDIGSETLYTKLLFVDYSQRFAVIELFGEWNDSLHNDIMYLKRAVIDRLLKNDIDKFIIITENIFQFHGGDTDYYEEWFEDIEDGWISLLSAPGFIFTEMQKYKLDYYLNFGGTLQLDQWRTMKPSDLFQLVSSLMTRRLGA